MTAIVLQYLPAGTDTAFLGIKQDYIAIPGYLAAFYVHVFTGILALPAGLTQFSGTLRKSYPGLHRAQGKFYVAAILGLAAPSGLYIGIFANGGPASQLAFVLLALLWFWTTLKAYTTIRAGNVRAHEAWMLRSFALTLSALTLRAWKWAIVGLFHPPPMDVYRIVAWLGWTLNLAIAEYLIFKKQRP
ncbi:DUF2306 domain-containing protein [Flaviaesturariibacter amylovorans]|uniref:DUF2306 domain-containing protein n=2 Tax=Flaviaesturariibacter amylovorans TaxID=1084520 RepID=A0ABP8HP57_9BACT